MGYFQTMPLTHLNNVKAEKREDGNRGPKGRQPSSDCYIIYSIIVDFAFFITSFYFTFYPSEKIVICFNVR